MLESEPASGLMPLFSLVGGTKASKQPKYPCAYTITQLQRRGHTHAHIRGSTQAHKHICRRVQEEKGFEHQDVHAHTPPFQAVTDTHIQIQTVSVWVTMVMAKPKGLLLKPS